MNPNDQNPLIDVIGTFDMAGEDIMPDVDQMIAYVDDDNYAPIATLMLQLGQTESLHNVEFRWPESRAETFQVVCNSPITGGGGTAGTEIQVTLAGLVAIGQVIYHGPTKQKFQVTSFVSRDVANKTTVCKLTRIPITQDRIAISTGATFRVLALQIPEGGYYPIGQGSRPVWQSNYVQLCTNVVSITKTMRKVQNWYGDQFQKDIKETIKQHRGNNERLLWFGEAINEMRTITNEDNKESTGQFRQAQGIDNRITSHRYPYATLDKQTLNDFINTACFGSRNSGPKETAFICGPGAIQDMNDMAMDQLTTLPGTEEFGLDIRQLKGYAGRRIAIIEEKEFMDDSDESGSIFKINLDNITVCYLGTHFMEVFPIEPPDRDIDAICFRTEWAPKFKLQQQAAKAYKVQSA